MSTPIEQNTTALQEILSIANSLPEASTEDLEAVIAEQEALIAELAAAVENKASGSGGASVETCTVIIYARDLDSGNGILCDYCATCYVNGEVVPKYIEPSTSAVTNSVTIENVICGSSMTVTVSKSVNVQSVTGGDSQIVCSSADGLRYILLVSTTPVDVSFSLHYS